MTAFQQQAMERFQSALDAALRKIAPTIAGRDSGELSTVADTERALSAGLSGQAAIAGGALLDLLMGGNFFTSAFWTENEAPDENADEKLLRTAADFTRADWLHLSKPLGGIVDEQPAAERAFELLTAQFPDAPPSAVMPCFLKAVTAIGQQGSWIGVKLVDHRGRPVAQEPFEVTDATGRVFSGDLNHLGSAKVAGLSPGPAKIAFPRLDKSYVQPG